MTDPRFFHRLAPMTLGAIAEAIGGELADPASAGLMIHDIASLETAGARDISLFADIRFQALLDVSAAGAVVTTRELAPKAPKACRLVLVRDARLAYARVGYLFYREPQAIPHISPHARIEPGATIGEAARIEAGAVVGEGAVIGALCHIGHNAVIGPGVVLGAGTEIGANSVVTHALVGERVRIGSCVTIGGPGFGFVPTADGPLRILQLGRVIIEDHVEIGANSAIDRGAAGDTVIGRGSVLDNLVQIGHNSKLGRYCVLSGQAGVAGSVVLGDGVMVGGHSAISDHLTMGAGARIAGGSGVMRDVAPGEVVGGYPAMPFRQWHRMTAILIRLARKKPGSGTL